MVKLADLVSLDNLTEPTPVWNHKAVIYGLVITSLIITAVCVGMRLYVRFIVTRTPGWDDWCVAVTSIVIVASNIGCCFMVEAGLGQHFVILGLAGVANFTRIFWWSMSLYNMALALVKLALLLQYLRVLDERPEIKQPMLRLAVLVMVGVVAAWGLVESLLAWIPCNPIHADWDFTGTVEATRWGFGSRDAEVFAATFYQHSASNMILDIIVLALPIFSKALWDTAETDKKSRAGMLGLFVLGGLTVSCSIVRFASQIQHKAGTSPSFDPTWYGASTTVLSVLEVDLATIVATLPVFWPHLRRNVASIVVTHEVEIKITRQSAFAGGPIASHRHGGSSGDVEWGWSGAPDGPTVREEEDVDPWLLPKLNLRSEPLMLRETNVDGSGLGIGHAKKPSLGPFGSISGKWMAPGRR